MEREALKLAVDGLEKILHTFAKDGKVVMASMIRNELFAEVNSLLQQAKASLAQPAQEPEYWNVIDPAGNIVATETNAIRGWARIPGSYKPTVEGLLGFHVQGWRVLPKINQIAQPAHSEWNAALDEAAARIGEIKGFGQATQDSFAVFIKGLKK